MSVVGSAANVLSRILKVLPRRWFKWVAPYRDAVIGGISDLAAWSYTLIDYAKAQTRLATAYGVWLDVFAYDFVGRTLTRDGLVDGSFRVLIKATILQEKVTRASMIAAITRITGIAPRMFEPWNTFDTGAYSNIQQGKTYGQFGYGVGNGGYGSMILPAQALIQIHRSAPSGVPNVDGYNGTIAGYGQGSIEYVGNSSQLIGITNEKIEKVINLTKPTGSIMWINFGA